MNADIVIIGAGFAGAATAYHLARLGQEDVLLVEREAIAGVHSSGRNAAIVREYADNPTEQQMMCAGASVLRRGHLAPFQRRGLFLAGGGEDNAEHYFSRAQGRGRWCPDDGTVDVATLLENYLHGRCIVYGVSVFGWTRDGYGLRIDTTQGKIHCRLLVNAAGAWAGELGTLPLTPMNRHLMVSVPMPWVNGDWPVVWDGPQHLYFRPESGGLLFSVCDEVPAAPGDYSENPDALEILAERIDTLQPGLGAIAIRNMWVGQRTFAPDRRFVIGFDPRDDRVFHVAGLGGHGVTASYTIGQQAAEMIVKGNSKADDPFAVDRLFRVGDCVR